MKKLAIISVDYNSHADTTEFLQSIKTLKIPRDFDVKLIVVDNGSDLLVTGEAEVIQAGENLGFTGGYNRGIRYAKQWGADYFLVINNDVLFPDSDLLTKLVKTAASDEEIGVVCPKILFAPGFEYHKARYSKKDLGKVIWYAGGSFDWANVATVHRGINDVDRGQYDAVTETEFPSGCCLLITRAVIERVGFFEEKLFAYFEDSDYALRVKQAGFRQVYNGQAKLWHKVSRSAGIGSKLTDYLTTRNQLFLGIKYADYKIKFALMRQAARLVLVGRSGQRQGVIAYFRNRFGRPDFLPTTAGPVYPLKLSIVIINYKTLELTRSLLKSIYKYPPNATFEVILIDNDSQDGCAEMVKEEFPQVKFIGNKVNTGFSGGNNQGIDYSRGEDVLLLNSDIEVCSGALNALIAAARQLPNSVLAGRLFFPDGTLQDSVFNLPTITGAIKEYFMGLKGSYFMYQPRQGGVSRVECAVMACFMIPWAVINRVGKLDEGTFMYFEDVDYARRLKQQNIPVYYIPTAKFIHHHGASSKVIGQHQAYQFSKTASLHYHGKIKYEVLRVVLWLGLRWGVVKNPVSRWTKGR